MARVFVAAIFASTLAACAPAPEMARGPAGPVPGFRCPPAGTTVVYDNRTRITWTGVDPTDPAVCLRTVETASGVREQPALFNYWWDTGGNHDVIRAGMASLFPLAPDRSASFSRAGVSSRMDAVDYLERWRVGGRETLTIGGQPREAWRLHRITEFTSWESGSFTGELTLWFDVETHALLRVRVGEVRGIWRGVGPMDAVELRLPGG